MGWFEDALDEWNNGEGQQSEPGGDWFQNALDEWNRSAAFAAPTVTLPEEYGGAPSPAYDFWNVTHPSGGASLSDNPELLSMRGWTPPEPRVTLPAWYGGYPRSAYGDADSYVTPGNVVAPTDERAQARARLWRSSPQSWRAQNEGLVTLPNDFATLPNEWGVSYPVAASTAMAAPTPTPMPTSTPTFARVSSPYSPRYVLRTLSICRTFFASPSVSIRPLLSTYT